MPFKTAQAVLNKILPDPAFEYVYRLATKAYNKKVELEDWAYYRKKPVNRYEEIKLEMIKFVLPYTMVGRKGLLATYKVTEMAKCNFLEGALVECGVARGGSALLMHLVNHRYGDLRPLWLFDTFEGLPKNTPEDGILRKPENDDRSSHDLAEGYCYGSLEEVEDLFFNKCGFSREWVTLVKGMFQDTLPHYWAEIGDIAVLRLDGDWYESTKCCLDWLYDSVLDYGFVIIDDYALEGCRKAVDEFIASRNIKAMIHEDGRGGAWFQRIITNGEISGIR